MVLLRVVVALVLLGFVGGDGHAKPESISIQFVVDNSGARQGAADDPLKRLLFHLSELRKSRHFQNATINIVSQNQPRNLWVGTPMELFRNGREVLGKIVPVVNGCSDLVGALLDQVQLNLEMQKPSKAYVFVFSSLIHTGSPCNEVTIELPQAVPKNLDVTFLAKSEISVRFLWVHSLQVKPWLEAVRKAGLSNAQIMDEETTKRFLQKGLFDE
jgi:hypothetical protein